MAIALDAPPAYNNHPDSPNSKQAVATMIDFIRRHGESP
jgi:hypothetical protein